MPITRYALALGATAFLATAAPASAGAIDDSIKMRIPDIPVAAGVIEHQTVETCWTSTGRLAEISPSACMIYEQYAATDRDREVVTTRDGALRGERATVDRTIFSWTWKENELVVGRGKGRASSLSFASEDGMWADTIARGWYAPAGEEVRDGRTVVKYMDTPNAPNVEGRDWVVLDKETGALVERGWDQTHSDSITRVLERETLPRNAQTEKLLVMGDHSDATVREVVGEDGVVASAAKKAGLKKKTRAKIRKTLRKARR